MKRVRISNQLSFLLILVSFLAACSSATTENVEKEKSEKADLQNANPIITAYLQLKDDLVETNAEKARKSAKKLYSSIDKLEGKETESLLEEARMIVESENIETQRLHFQELSDKLYAYAQMEDMGIILFRQYCPMAFENKGAYWLSSESEIMNPYFGDKMLHCGVVKDEF